MTTKHDGTGDGGAEPRLIPLMKWNDFHAWPTVNGLRHLVRHRKENGFDACIVRPRRALLIDEAAFFRWLESKRVSRSEA